MRAHRNCSLGSTMQAIVKELAIPAHHVKPLQMIKTVQL